MAAEESRPDSTSIGTPPAQSQPPSPDQGPGGKKPRRWWRWALAGVAAVFLLLLLGVALVPTVLSTDSGKRWILGAVNDRIAGDVQADSLSLSWLGGQSLSNVQVSDPQGKLVLQARSIQSSTSLLSAVTGSRKISARVVSPDVRLVQYEDGSTNLQRAMASSGPGASPAPQQPSNQPARLPADSEFRFEIVDGKVEFLPVGSPAITLPDVQAVFAVLQGGQDIQGTVQTPVQQDSQQGQIKATLNVSQLFNAQGEMQPAAAKVDLQANVTQLPVPLADLLARQQGRLTSILGSRVSVQVQAQGNPGTQFTADIQASSQNLRPTQITLQMDPQKIEVTQLAGKLEVSPATYESLTTQPGQPPAAKLLQPVTLEIKKLGPIVLARQGEQKIDPLRSEAAIGFGSSDVLLDAGGNVGQVALRQLQGRVNLQGANNRAALLVTAVAEQNGSKGNLRLHGEAGSLFLPDGTLNQKGMQLAAEASATNTPLALADPLLGEDRLATRLLGQTLSNLTAKLQRDAAQPDVLGLTLLAKSPNLQLNMGATYDQKARTLAALPQAGGSFRLTADGYNALQGRVPALKDYQLMGDMPLNLAIDKLQLTLADRKPAPPAAAGQQPAPATLPIDPVRSQFALRLTSPSASVRVVQDQQVIPLQNIEITAQSADLTQQIQITLEAEYPRELPAPQPPTSPAPPTQPVSQPVPAASAGGTPATLASAAQPTAPSQPSKPAPRAPGAAQPVGTQAMTLRQLKPGLRSKVTMRDVVRSDGLVQLAAATFTTQTTAQLPTPLIASLGKQDARRMELMLGPVSQLQVQGNYPGDLDVLFASDNAWVPARATVRQGVLTLREDSQFMMRVTPELSNNYLVLMNPLLRDAVAAEQPISLTLRQKDLKVPLSPFDVTQMRGDASLELGTLVLKNSWAVQGLDLLLRELKLAGAAGSDRARFTAFSVHIENGVAHSNDLWMLLGDLSLGAQGTVDLKRKETQLYLGLPGDVLSRGDLRKVIDPAQTYVIPYTGPVSQMNVRWGAFTRQVLEAAAKAQLAGVLGGEVPGVGQLIGGALGGNAPQVQGLSWANRPARQQPPAPEDVLGKPAPQNPQPGSPQQPAAPQQPGTQQPKPQQPPQQQPPQKKPGLLDVLQQELDRREQEKKQKREQEQQQQNQQPPQQNQQQK